MPYTANFDVNVGAACTWDDFVALFARIRSEQKRWINSDPGKAGSSSQGTAMLGASPQWLSHQLAKTINDSSFLSTFSGITAPSFGSQTGRKILAVGVLEDLDQITSQVEAACAFGTCGFGFGCSGFSPWNCNSFAWTCSDFLTAGPSRNICGLFYSGFNCASGFGFGVCFSFFFGCFHSGNFGFNGSNNNFASGGSFFKCWSGFCYPVGSFGNTCSSSFFATFKYAGFHSSFDAGSFVYTFAS